MVLPESQEDLEKYQEDPVTYQEDLVPYQNDLETCQGDLGKYPEGPEKYHADHERNLVFLWNHYQAWY